MSTSAETELSAPPVSPAAVHDHKRPWTMWHAILVGMAAAFFLLLNYLPLRATDLWGHVLYGQWMLEHRALPTEDPILKLAAGMPVIASAWLSQVIYAVTERAGGAEALSNLFAVVVLATYLVLARTYFLQTRSAAISLTLTVLALIVGFSRLTTIRPENFGALAFAVLLWLSVSSGLWPQGDSDSGTSTKCRWKSALLWIGVPAVMCLWANLHGSFICGLALLGCIVAGQAIDAWLRHRNLLAALMDWSVCRPLLVFELAVLATCLNPYGPDLLLSTLRFSGNENLRELTEWQPLILSGVGGREFALSGIVLLIVLRHSRRPMRAAEWVSLAVFGYLAANSIRMLGWYAPVFALVVAPHLQDVFAQLRCGELLGWLTKGDLSLASATGSPVHASQEKPATGPAWKYPAICGLIVWVAFTFSGLSRPVLGGKPRSEELLYGQSTPYKLTEWLREHPPTGQLFTPQHWGDWLAWAGPPGLQPFATGNVHLAPRQLWLDYQQISGGAAQWQLLLDRYRV